MLVGALVVATLGITAAATLLSFLAFQSLAVLVGWDPATAWLVQPVVELFVLAGAAEMAMRTWERREDRALPEVLMYAALTVSIAINVSSHVLNNYAEHRVGWQTAVIGAMAALVPLAQVGGVFLLTDRLRALGDRRTTKGAGDGEADEGREGRGAEGVPGGAGGSGREQGQDGDGQVPAGEPAGDQRGEGRPLVPAAALSAGGSGGLAPEPDPSAPGLAELADSNGNGHGVTLKKQAEREARRYLAANGVLPSENVLAGLARCSRGTARNALAPLKKG
jgi:hypothetical protein